ncbi:hypothetical protein [Methylobacterium indicum]|uniref:Uncharacterized protein n=1 Tax=Methylobacterium indicum TaxID=1775910 RepID=A0A8H8X185_9HYPH|nr:hypothetical protein [Methylobacterium indicum]BCM87834.1 hypothetical protein mvi_62950 [Methylobacterium indicum]
MSRRKRPTQAEITAMWDLLDDDNKSTEWVMQRVVDHFEGKVDEGDVADALMRRTDVQPARQSD